MERTDINKMRASNIALAEAVTRVKAKNRVFKKPTDPIEELPTLEVMAHYGSGRVKSKAEILESGEILELIRLYFSNIDLSTYVVHQESLTRREERIIINKVREKGDLVNLCEKEYYTVLEFGNTLRYYLKLVQSSLGIICGEVAQIDFYNKIAKNLTEELHRIELAKFKIGEKEKWAPLYTIEQKNEWIQYHLKGNLYNGKLYYNEDKKVFSYLSKDLQTNLERDAQVTRECMEDAAAASAALYDFYAKSVLKFLPANVRMNMANIFFETYPRYLVQDPTRYESELNKRKLKGETISLIDEQRAIIPDFLTVVPNGERYEISRSQIKTLMEKS